MDYKITQKGDKIILEDINDFELSHTFECGQCFRWNKEEDGSYTGVVKGKVLNVSKEGNKIIFDCTSMDDFLNIWVDYFDLKRDYGWIKKKLGKKDDILKKAIEYGYGIRILNQDVWETLISFIISSNRNIPLIKKSIESLCEKYGMPIGEYKGRTYYSFPEVKDFFDKSVEEIKESYTGYRAKYIVDTVKMIQEKKILLYKLKKLSTDDARKELMKFCGVGPKVADCILLFSMGKYDAFPIDVWVKRVMDYFYRNDSLKDIKTFAQDRFGEYGGFAQQYLFYYARELGIGK